MFLDDKLQEIWDKNAHERTGKCLKELMDECYDRINKNNIENSLKQIDASWRLFAERNGLSPIAFRKVWFMTGVKMLEHDGCTNIDEKMKELCEYLNWNYNELKGA